MMDAGDAADASTVQLFQANLAEIGITLSVETVTFSTLTGVLFRDVEPEEQPNLMQWGWWPAYNDAWSHLQAQVLCSAQGSAGTNAGYYCNPRVDELLTQARDTTDPATYERVLAEVQQILSRDDPPAIYYLQPQWSTVLRRDIQGFAFNPIYVGTFDFFALRREA
jgi:peptide/nickel transport system substrate-binding protein